MSFHTKMHFDKDRYLKFMIYLRDVGEGDGGITFAKKEWNTSLQEELLSREALKEENVEVDDLSKIEEMKGLAVPVLFLILILLIKLAKYCLSKKD